jgi:hypothetical protein
LFRRAFISFDAHTVFFVADNAVNLKAGYFPVLFRFTSQ